MVPSPTKTQPYEARIDGWMDGHTAAMRPMWQLMHLEQHLLTIWPHSNRNDNSISTSSKKQEGTQNSRHRLRDRLHFFVRQVSVPWDLLCDFVFRFQDPCSFLRRKGQWHAHADRRRRSRRLQCNNREGEIWTKFEKKSKYCCFDDENYDLKF